MYILKGKNRAMLRKDAREIIRLVRGNEIVLAHPNMHAIAYDAVRKAVLPAVRESPEVRRVPGDIIREQVSRFSRALASHAYEQELLSVLKTNLRSKLALMAFGMKKEHADRAIAESRRRLDLAKKAEGAHARALALLPKAVRQPHKYGRRYEERLSKASELMWEYYASLSDFYAKAARARRKRELQ